MMAKVLVVLAPFLSFASTYNASKVHNMLILMLEPCFKSFNLVEPFVRRQKSYKWWGAITR